ncbi:hypothetical protein N0V90_010680 [Kalmusia sp. IMI 367209]|nr:hypothetical protein N0V90_010680 [Kalmusia sp. IMI 367209]
MTQPSVNMTFDTSLIDTQNPNTSFSTTESDPSDAGPPFSVKTPIVPQTSPTVSQLTDVETPKQSQGPPTPTPILPPPKTSTPIQNVPTQDAYNQWASVYDTDGNMLQAIDDLELLPLLPAFLDLVAASNKNKKLDVLDLGCGTGRNTAKVLAYAWHPDRRISITASDFSAGMLDVAAKKLRPLIGEGTQRSLLLEHADYFPEVDNPEAKLAGLRGMDGVLSTLVLEHVDLEKYFRILAKCVKEGGYALVTNMHSEMGKVSQAGFINAEGVKVRGQSFAHTPKESVEAAVRAGFEVVSLKERQMSKEDVESGRVGERGRKWIGMHVWYGMVLRRL